MMIKENVNEDEPKIKIYVSCHKECYIPKMDFLYPIQVGTALAKEEIPGILHDNTGENISASNKRYCELTAQYWAWKNDYDSDYYGFMHYRRYFSFNSIHLEEDCYGNIVMDGISQVNLERLCYNKQVITDLVKQNDIITVTPTNLKDIGKTVYGHYKNFSHDHRIEDYELAVKIINRDYPELKDAVTEYSNSSWAYFCNMYIIKRNLFNQYNQWLFEVLRKHGEERSYDDYSYEENRISAFLAERLWGIYYTYLKKNPAIKTVELQRTLFADTEVNHTLSPAFSIANVPVVFSANQDYLPYVSVTICSLIVNSSKDYNYDVVILHSKIEQMAIDAFIEQFANYKNLKIRFFDVTKIIKDIDFKVNSHFSKENYFRLLIQFIMKEYKTVIYLDSDLIVLHDLSELFNIEMGEKLVCAVKDVDWIAAYNSYDPNRQKYAKDILNLTSPYEYFNSGVLVYNVEQFKKEISFHKLTNMFNANNWMFVDQDILNIICEGKVQFLDMKWNVLTDYREKGYSRMQAAKVIPYKLYDEYLLAYKNPFIIHFAGCKKPWDFPESDKANLFWIYARQNEYYEQILKRLCKKVVNTETLHIHLNSNPEASHTEQMAYHDVKIETLNEPIYTDGVMVKAINKFNKKYPIGLKRRDWLRRVIKIFC